MTTLSQFLGSSSMPLGSITAKFPKSQLNLLTDSSGDYYIRTGSSFPELSASDLSNISSKSTDFLVNTGNSFSLGEAGKFSSYAYGNGVYVRYSDASSISSPSCLMYSTDLVSWNFGKTDTYIGTVGGGSVVFGNGLFVATAAPPSGVQLETQNFGIMISSDGINWKESEITPFLFNETEPSGQQTTRPSLTWDGTYFWFTAGKYTAGNATIQILVYRSTDAKNWVRWVSVDTNSAVSSQSTIKAVINGSNVVIARGGAGGQEASIVVLRGTVSSYANSAITGLLSSLKALNGNFVGTIKLDGVSTSAIITSTTGASWTTRSIPTASILNDASYGNSVYVAVGNSGRIFTSTDLSTWTLRTSGTAQNLQAIEYVGSLGLFVVRGDTGVFTSADGVTWAAATINASLGTRGTNSFNNFIESIQFLNGNLIVSQGSADSVITSTNGTSWSARLIGGVLSTSNSRDTTTVRGSTSSALFNFNGNLVACPSLGGILSATTTANQWKIDEANLVYTSVASSGSVYVAVGPSGRIKTSTDLSTWTSRTSGTATALTAVVWTGTHFIAVGSNITLRSSDGITWTSVNGSNGGTLTCSSGSAVAIVSSTTLRISADHGLTWSSFSTSTPFSNLLDLGDNYILAFGAGVNSVIIREGTPSRLGSIDLIVDGAAKIGDVLYVFSQSGSTFRTSSYPYSILTASSAASGDSTNMFTIPGQVGAAHQISQIYRISDNTWLAQSLTGQCFTGWGYSSFVTVSSIFRETAPTNGTEFLNRLFYDTTGAWVSRGTTFSVIYSPRDTATSLYPTVSATEFTNLQSSYAENTGTTYLVGSIQYRKIT